MAGLILIVNLAVLIFFWWATVKLFEKQGVQSGWTHLVGAIVGVGADVNASSRNGTTPLHFAARDHDTAIIQSLTTKDLDPNVFATTYDRSPGDDLEFPFECAPIHWGLSTEGEPTKKLGAIEALLATGANPNAYSGDCRLPLDHASMTGDAMIVRALIRAGADPSVSFALYYAVTSDNLEVARLLIDSGASVEHEVRQRSRLPFLSDLLNEPLVAPGGRSVTPLSLATSDAMRALLTNAGAK